MVAVLQSITAAIQSGAIAQSPIPHPETDRSGAILATNVAQEWLPENEDRVALEFVNTDDTDIWMNVGGTAVANGAGSFLIGPGGFYAPRRFVPREAISILGTVHGKFTGREVSPGIPLPAPITPFAVSVMDHGAVGDGVADDTNAINAAIAAVNVEGGGVVAVPPATYQITAALTLSADVRLVGYGATIRQVTAGTRAILITGSNTSVEGLTIQGVQFDGELVANEEAISATGASAAAPLVGVTVKDCVIHTWGIYGVWMKWVDQFTVTGNVIRDISYAAVMLVSSLHGVVARNQISNIVNDSAANNFNAYGVAATKLPGDLVTHPRSEWIEITDNLVEDVPTWEGIDTHAGSHVTIRRNTIRRCKDGIMVTSGQDGGGAQAYAAHFILIDSNFIEGEAGATSPMNFGVRLHGGATEAATNCRITSNTIRYCADAADVLAGGIAVYHATAVRVDHNTILEPASNGIAVYSDCASFMVDHNVVTDPWGEAAGYGVAYHVTGGTNSGTFAYNQAIRGSKTATHVLTNVVLVAAGVGNAVTVIP